MCKRDRKWRPSLFSIEDIEYDLRIGRTKFLEWVKIGWMPQPYAKDGGVTRWLAEEIDEYLGRFPNRDLLKTEQRRQSLRNKITQKPRTNWKDQRSQ